VCIEQRCAKLAPGYAETDLDVLERKFQTKLTSAQNKVERKNYEWLNKNPVNNRRLELSARWSSGHFSPHQEK
jgi:hypothetical protein